jgi:hypothetical protein
MLLQFNLASSAKARRIGVPMRAPSGNEYAAFDARKPQAAQVWNKTDTSRV